MPFQPGQSGNPGGRPKEAAEVKALARSFCREAIETLVRLMRSQDEKVAKAASDSLLDRGIGKPSQPIVGGDEEDPPVKVSGVLTLVKPEGQS